MRARGSKATLTIVLALVAAACDARPSVVAALEDGEGAVRAALARAADVNATDAEGMTALQKAASRGDVRSVTALVEGGARVDIGSGGGKSALFLAASRGQTACAYVLLRAGADANARGGPLRATPLHEAVLAASPELVEALLAHGADANARNAWGEAPLHLTARLDGSHARSIALALSAHQADFAARDARGHTPLHEAAANDNLGLIALYQELGLDLSPVSVMGVTPLDVAVATDRPRAAQKLFALGAKRTMPDFEPPLHRAARVDDIDTAQVLLAFGAEPGLVFEGKTASDVAREHRSARVLALLR